MWKPAGSAGSCGASNGVSLSSTALAMGLCVAMIAFVRLPSLKVSCLLLSGLLIYDVFWVRPGPARGSWVAHAPPSTK